MTIHLGGLPRRLHLRSVTPISERVASARPTLDLLLTDGRCRDTQADSRVSTAHHSSASIAVSTTCCRKHLGITMHARRALIACAPSPSLANRPLGSLGLFFFLFFLPSSFAARAVKLCVRVAVACAHFSAQLSAIPSAELNAISSALCSP